MKISNLSKLIYEFLNNRSKLNVSSARSMIPENSYLISLFCGIALLTKYKQSDCF